MATPEPLPPPPHSVPIEPAGGRLAPVPARRRGGRAGWGRRLLLGAGLLLIVAGSAAGGAAAAVWWLGQQGLGPGVPASAQGVFPVFWQAWRLVEDRYVEGSAAEPKSLTYGAIRGMVDSLGDDGHSRFLTPEEVELEETSLAGHFVGIGAEVAIKDGRPTIVSPYDGSPADRAGLRPGDVILTVDGQSADKWTVDELVTHVRGQAGTTVHLTALRPATGVTSDYAIVREVIDLPAVSWAMLPVGNIAQIRLSEFSEGAVDELKQAVAEARAKGARGIIFDIRDNPGGLFDQAIAVASQFVERGNVVLERDRSGQVTPFPARRGGVALDLPLVVLVNKGSASSSEIVAGAIQAAGRGRIIGETTFGTGTVLSNFPLEDGSAILLGTSEWLTPNGNLIKGKGIQPDLPVALPPNAEPLSPAKAATLTPDALNASQDDQLKRAVQVLAAAGQE